SPARSRRCCACATASPVADPNPPTEMMPMKTIKGLKVTTAPSGAPVSRMRIGGRWGEGGSGGFLEGTSPAAGAGGGFVPLGPRADAQRAIAAANAAKPKIAGLSVWERAKLCFAVADAIETRKEALARILCLEQGKPYHAEALGEVGAAVAAFRNAGEQIK